MEFNLEENVEESYKTGMGPFDKTVTRRKKDGIYLFDATNVSQDGFQVRISKVLDDKKKEVVGNLKVDYRTKGPASFLPEFERPSVDNLALSNIAITYAMSAIRKDNMFDNYRLLLDSDFDASRDKGKKKLYLFDALGKINNMEWSKNKQGQQYSKQLSRK